jgi:hypothetical protein
MTVKHKLKLVDSWLKEDFVLVERFSGKRSNGIIARDQCFYLGKHIISPSGNKLCKEVN